jgi:hypothetical protein
MIRVDVKVITVAARPLRVGGLGTETSNTEDETAVASGKRSVKLGATLALVVTGVVRIMF